MTSQPIGPASSSDSWSRGRCHRKPARARPAGFLPFSAAVAAATYPLISVQAWTHSE